jgi:propanol-preferring alcohol dehydrogenase
MKGNLMATKMKCAVVHQFKSPLSLEEWDVPEINDNQILVKIHACGVCHTDLHAAHGDWPVKPTLPFIPGHEGVGEIVKTGKNVTNVSEGDRVGIPWLHTACGQCKYCLSGWETLCTQQQNTGYSVNGSFAEYAAADPNYVGHLPEGLSYEEAAPILCAGVTVYKGLKETDAKPGQIVGISGIGGLGHLAVQYAKAMGFTVVAIDIAEDKLDLARRHGADLTVNALNDDAVQASLKETGGLDGLLVTAVSTNAFDLGLKMLARKGTMSLVGLPKGDFPLNIFDTVLSRKTIRGSIVGTRLDLQESLQYAADGKVRSTYSVEKLEDINSIFERMLNGTIEGRIVMQL